MPMLDLHNSQLGGEGVIRNSAFILIADHAFACLIENCADLPWALVLAIIPQIVQNQLEWEGRKPMSYRPKYHMDQNHMEFRQCDINAQLKPISPPTVI